MVTHPEAEHHIAGLVGGWHDSVLTERGRAQATAVARRLRGLIPGGAGIEVVSSDLLRTRETADIVAAELDVTPALDERLREKSYGAAEGRPQQWLDERFIAPPAVGDRMHHREGVDGAETRHDIASRIYAAVDDILRSKCRQSEQAQARDNDRKHRKCQQYIALALLRLVLFGKILIKELEFRTRFGVECLVNPANVRKRFGGFGGVDADIYIVLLRRRRELDHQRFNFVLQRISVKVARYTHNGQLFHLAFAVGGVAHALAEGILPSLLFHQCFIHEHGAGQVGG